MRRLAGLKPLSAALLLALTLSGCVKKVPESGSPTGKNAVSPQAGAQPTVTLLEPGSAPRELMRYVFTVGEPQTALMVMNMGMDMDMGEMMKQNIKTPPMEMVMRFVPQKVDAKGSLTYGFELVSAEAKEDPNQPGMAAAINAKLVTMVGLKGSGVVNTQGFTLDATFQNPEGMSEEMRSTMDTMQKSTKNMSSPLPTEPVGVGARWQVSQALDTPGLKGVQRTVYTLRERRGNLMVIDLEVVQEASPQNMAMPNLPEGSTVYLNRFHSQGAGHMDLALDRLIPTSSVSTSTESEMAIKSGDMEQSMKMRIDLQMTIGEQK